MEDYDDYELPAVLGGLASGKAIAGISWLTGITGITTLFVGFNLAQAVTANGFLILLLTVLLTASAVTLTLSFRGLFVYRRLLLLAGYSRRALRGPVLRDARPLQDAAVREEVVGFARDDEVIDPGAIAEEEDDRAFLDVVRVSAPTPPVSIVKAGEGEVA